MKNKEEFERKVFLVFDFTVNFVFKLVTKRINLILLFKIVFLATLFSIFSEEWGKCTRVIPK